MDGDRPDPVSANENINLHRLLRMKLTSVNAEDLVINDDAQSQKVKHVCKIMPYIGVSVFPTALGVKTVRLRDASRLVVSANEMYTVRVPQFEAYEQRYCLYTEHAAVDIVTEEEVIRIWAVSANAEDLDKVEELSVDIANDGDGSCNMDDIALAH